jgi:methionyl aminopeptidase
MVEIKTAAEIGVIRAAGRIVARVLAAARAEAAAGMRLSDLDELARSVLAALGAR